MFALSLKLVLFSKLICGNFFQVEFEYQNISLVNINIYLQLNSYVISIIKIIYIYYNTICVPSVHFTIIN